MKVAYCGFDLFIQAFDIIEECGHDVIAVFSMDLDQKTEFSGELRARAMARDIPFETEPMSDSDIAGLAARGCDMVFCAGYRYLVPSRPEGMVGLNVHPSLLPHGRGPDPIRRALWENWVETGITTHLLDDDFDTGDILHQSTLAMIPQETNGHLRARLQVLLKQHLKEVLEDLPTKLAQARPQGEGESKGVLGAEAFTIDFDGPLERIDKQLRCFQGTGCFARLDGTPYWALDGEVHATQTEEPAGTVLAQYGKQILVAADGGHVLLRRTFVPARPPDERPT